MKLFIAILICKLAYFFGSKIGKGSSLPGKIALKICPNALRLLRLPGLIIAVTGSNGKTSTTEMIAHALAGVGLRVGWNHEGSNQTEGVATLVLRKATFRGAVKCDALVLECDERYASKIFAQIQPTALLVTNLCRDQLTRNGHHEFIQDCLREAVETAGESMKLVLNADDPFVAALANGRLSMGESAESGIVWFGLSSKAATEYSETGIYDDGAFCPCCKNRMSYNYRITAHFGSFKCSACELIHKKPDVEVLMLDYSSGEISLNTTTQGDIINTKLAEPSINNAYNLAAATAALKAVNINPEEALLKLRDYKLTGGRTMQIPMGNRCAELLICKHENSLAYNNSLAWIAAQKKPCAVVVMVDSISRKYYTSETSWLWDVDFDILMTEPVKQILLAGRYSDELMMRFMMSDVNLDKCRQVEKLTTLRECIEESNTEKVYILTCFSDKAKLIKTLGN